jgi:hypothetical protein
MAEHSKVATAAKQNFTQIMLNALVGSPKKKAFSAFLLAIIGFLIYMKNKKSTTDNIKIKEQPNKKAVNMVIFRKEEKDRLTPYSSSVSKNLSRS